MFPLGTEAMSDLGSDWLELCKALSQSCLSSQMSTYHSRQLHVQVCQVFQVVRKREEVNAEINIKNIQCYKQVL